MFLHHPARRRCRLRGLPNPLPVKYFTPRALIAAMVECVAPEPGKIREAFAKHPEWKDGEVELRDLRKQVTFAVFSEEEELEKVAVTVELLFRLLEKAFRK